MQMPQGRCEARFNMAERLHVVADFRLLHALRVRWAEVDLQKIVFNPHYLAYVDTAMADYWRLGGDLFVTKSTLEFHASAHYDDRLTVGLRCARIGNSSLQFLSGIFRDQELLVSAELVYVFADPVAKTALTVPPPLRDTMLAYEQGQQVVRQQTARWDEVQAVVQRLRASDDEDADALHCVLRNALDEPIATARIRAQTPEPDGLAVIDSLRGAGWARAAAAALRQLPKPSVASLSP